MGSVLEFYGQGLERIMELAEDWPGELHAQLVNDSVVRGLLLIHGLHPLGLETRLLQALDKVRPYMESHGGSVALLSLENDFARLRLEGACKTCASSASTMELAVRQAIEEACPDLAGFEVEGVEATPPSTTAAPPSWVSVPEADGMMEGTLRPVHSENLPLLLCKAGGQMYAYRDRCPACNMPLHLGALSGHALSCRDGHRYDVRGAGRSLDGLPGHLDPLPLLSEDGVVKVARAAA
jgi:Fe-S cluster biogenesis protein NfuA/nitrite reductase/ring-hydroxylating ferredoxin subunit